MTKRTPQELADAKAYAKSIDLPQLARDLGLTLIRTGSGFRCKEMDSLNFYMRNGEWLWKRFSQDKGGDAIAFVQEFTEHTSFMEALDYLADGRFQGEIKEKAYTPKPAVPEKPKVFVPPEENNNCFRAYAYLNKTRKLDGDIINRFIESGLISQEKRHGNIIFKIRDDKGNYLGAEIVGTYTGSRFKMISEGLPEGFGFTAIIGDPNRIFFFESAIDMMSYLQANREDMKKCVLVSMGGLKHTIVEKTVERFGISYDNVIICSDNDEKGNLFAEKLKAKYPEIKRDIPPSEKDWNDYIRTESYEKSRLELEQRKEIARRTFESNLTSKCSDFLISVGIDVSKTDFEKRLNSQAFKTNSSYEMALCYLNEVADILYEKQICDFKFVISDNNRFEVYDSKDKRICSGEGGKVLRSLKFYLAARHMIGKNTRTHKLSAMQVR